MFRRYENLMQFLMYYNSLVKIFLNNIIILRVKMNIQNIYIDNFFEYFNLYIIF